MKNEIIIYQSDELATHIDVRVEDETVWLTQIQIVNLFQSSKANISEHIKHIFQTKELEEKATVRKFRTVRIEGNRTVSRELIHYNLDMIISIGYRVNSIQGTQFRIWANSILKDYLLKGYSLNSRMNRIEDNVHDLKERVEKIDLQLSTDNIPKQGIFYEGQIFDAHMFVSDLFSRVKKSVIVIDNYIDKSILNYLSQLPKNVKAKIYSRSISENLKFDIDKFEKQHFPIEVKIYKKSHDRFMIIDDKEVYHIGASIKDLGKKLFGFSKMDRSLLNF